MSGKISRWGNSVAVRIPKEVLEQAGLREGVDERLGPFRAAEDLELAVQPPVEGLRLALLVDAAFEKIGRFGSAAGGRVHRGGV